MINFKYLNRSLGLSLAFFAACTTTPSRIEFAIPDLIRFSRIDLEHLAKLGNYEKAVLPSGKQATCSEDRCDLVWSETNVPIYSADEVVGQIAKVNQTYSLFRKDVKGMLRVMDLASGSGEKRGFSGKSGSLSCSDNQCKIGFELSSDIAVQSEAWPAFLSAFTAGLVKGALSHSR